MDLYTFIYTLVYNIDLRKEFAFFIYDNAQLMAKNEDIVIELQFD